jgi:hypothetical protein
VQRYATVVTERLYIQNAMHQTALDRPLHKASERTRGFLPGRRLPLSYILVIWRTSSKASNVAQSLYSVNSWGNRMVVSRFHSSFLFGNVVIDYRCEDGRFPVYASCVTISNPDSLYSSETGINPGIRSWKKHLPEWSWCHKAVGGIYITKKWRAETLQPGLEFDNFKSWLKIGFF